MMHKKAMSLDVFGGAIISFIVVAVVAVVGFLINAALQAQTTSGTSAYNATTTVNTSMTTLVNFLPIIAVVVAGAFVIGVLGLMRGREGGV